MSTPLSWKLLRRLLFLLDAEQAHHLTLQLVGRHPRALGRLFGSGPERSTQVGGSTKVCIGTMRVAEAGLMPTPGLTVTTGRAGEAGTEQLTCLTPRHRRAHSS